MTERMIKIFVGAWAFIKKNLGLIVAVLIISITTIIYKIFGVAVVTLNIKILNEHNLVKGGVIIFSYTIILALLVLRIFFSKNNKLLNWFKKILGNKVSLDKKEKNKKGKEERIVLAGLFITLPAFFLIYTKELGFEIKSHVLFFLFLLSNLMTTMIAIFTALFLKDYPISFLLLFLILIFFIIRKKILEKIKNGPV